MLLARLRLVLQAYRVFSQEKVGSVQSDLSVLIVDSSADTREVLRTALARHGVQVLEANARPQGLSIAHEQHPDVIVVDLVDPGEDTPEVMESFSDGPESADTPIVILGTARQKKTATSGDFFTKPYHYAPLIRTIEQRLERCKNTQRQKTQRRAA
jgi:CheY-like chemotaxis protein